MSGEAKATIVAALIALVGGGVYQFGPTLKKWYTGEDNIYHVIVLSTPDDKEAINKANQLATYGYSPEVYASSNRQYAVSIGKFKKYKAISVKKEIIDRGLVRSDSYLANPDGLVRKIYSPDNISSDEVDQPQCYLISFIADSKSDADKYLQYLVNLNCRPMPAIMQVDGKFGVVLGKHNCDIAEDIRNSLIQDRIIYMDAYVSRDLTLPKVSQE